MALAAQVQVAKRHIPRAAAGTGRCCLRATGGAIASACLSMQPVQPGDRIRYRPIAIA